MLKHIEITNFMSISSAVLDFDDTNIINIKGYNDSGKSAILRALDVLFYNIRPNAQVNFIKDDCDYFRILAKFDDGVTIFRDKYINGQSLYEMYKDDECIYTTKVNGTLTKVSEVPEPIKQYLGLLSYEGTMLNSRSCFEKQFLVQTTGSENYKVLNVVLRAEELATAGQLLNNDKNTLGSNISQLDTQISTYREMCKDGEQLTETMLSTLESLDRDIDSGGVRVEHIDKIMGTHSELQNVPVYPEISMVETARANRLGSITGFLQKINAVQVYDEVPTVDGNKLSMLERQKALRQQISSIHVGVEVPVVNGEKLYALTKIKSILDKPIAITPEISDINCERLVRIGQIFDSVKSCITELSRQREIDKAIADTQKELDKLSASGDFRKCPNCGTLVPV